MASQVSGIFWWHDWKVIFSISQLLTILTHFLRFWAHYFWKYILCGAYCNLGESL